MYGRSLIYKYRKEYDQFWWLRSDFKVTLASENLHSKFYFNLKKKDMNRIKALSFCL